MTPFTAGAILLVFLVVVVYFGFTKHIPFTHGFRVKAVFESANSMRPSSPVRIAGVNVGKVKDIQRQGGTDAAVVTMELEDAALPIHKDATLKIRPRIFLEGNFFVDVKPGTPSAPELSDGDTVPITQTATPVQLDQVLTVAAVRHARRPPGRARQLRRRAEPEAHGRAGRRSGPVGAGQDGRRGAQQRVQVQRAGAARHRDRQPGGARHPARATSPSSSRASAASRRRWTATRASSRT